MKKYVDGKYIEMTAEEIASLPKDTVVIAEPTILERLEAVEELLLDAALDRGDFI